MSSRLRTMVAPAYLFACLLLGGSAQGVWFNMVLQLAGIAIIAWAGFARSDEPLSPAARQLLLLALLGIAFVALQLIPLPPDLWSALPGRAKVAGGFSVLGVPVPWAPLSLAPAETLNSLLGVIPPLAMICAMVRLKAYRPVTLALALIAGTLAGIALVALQVGSSSGELSRWYIYPNTNPGRGVGFFANLNHMGTLLVITIPFLAAVVAAGTGRGTQRYMGTVAVAAGVAVLLMVGIALNGSLAGYGLAVPVAAGSLLILLPPASRLRVWAIGLTALLLVAAVVALEAAPIAGGIGQHANISVSSRSDILKTTARAARGFMPFGSGLGSFERTYPLYEIPTKIDGTYVIHAHNDYAELLLELGVAGALLILLFIGWWVMAVRRLITSTEPKPFARAAGIASAAMLLHSFVDFPLRTAAIAACFGMCIALLADGRAAAPVEKKRLRRNRHVEFR